MVNSSEQGSGRFERARERPLHEKVFYDSPALRSLLPLPRCFFTTHTTVHDEPADWDQLLCGPFLSSRVWLFLEDKTITPAQKAAHARAVKKEASGALGSSTINLPNAVGGGGGGGGGGNTSGGYTDFVGGDGIIGCLRLMENGRVPSNAMMLSLKYAALLHARGRLCLGTEDAVGGLAAKEGMDKDALKARQAPPPTTASTTTTTTAASAKPVNPLCGLGPEVNEKVIAPALAARAKALSSGPPPLPNTEAPFLPPPVPPPPAPKDASDEAIAAAEAATEAWELSSARLSEVVDPDPSCTGCVSQYEGEVFCMSEDHRANARLYLGGGPPAPYDPADPDNRGPPLADPVPDPLKAETPVEPEPEPSSSSSSSGGKASGKHGKDGKGKDSHGHSKDAAGGGGGHGGEGAKGSRPGSGAHGHDSAADKKIKSDSKKDGGAGGAKSGHHGKEGGKEDGKDGGSGAKKTPRSHRGDKAAEKDRKIAEAAAKAAAEAAPGPLVETLIWRVTGKGALAVAAVEDLIIKPPAPGSPEAVAAAAAKEAALVSGGQGKEEVAAKAGGKKEEVKKAAGGKGKSGGGGSGHAGDAPGSDSDHAGSLHSKGGGGGRGGGGSGYRYGISECPPIPTRTPLCEKTAAYSRVKAESAKADTAAATAAASDADAKKKQNHHHHHHHQHGHGGGGRRWGEANVGRQPQRI